jgi:hypothetical protein
MHQELHQEPTILSSLEQRQSFELELRTLLRDIKGIERRLIRKRKRVVELTEFIAALKEL